MEELGLDALPGSGELLQGRNALRSRRRQGAPLRLWQVALLPRPSEVAEVCRLISAGKVLSRLGNPADPLDDLIYILLSNKTSPDTAERVFRELRATYADWKLILSAPARQLQDVLRPAGLWNIRADQIHRLLARVVSDWGSCSLEHLKPKAAADAEMYLTSLPGVSTKVAKCVMLFTLNHPVLPVDVHVHRIAYRLGWIRCRRADQSHAALESIVAPELRYTFHVASILHGRAVCRPVNPRCSACGIRRHCTFAKASQKEAR